MADNTWVATEASLASTDANWSLGHKPVAGETPVFDQATSANNCSWDYAIADLASITLTGAAAGGTVAQAQNVGAVGAWSNAQWIWKTSTKTFTVGDATLGAAGQLQQTGTAGNVTVASWTQNGAGSVLVGKEDTRLYCAGNFLHTAGSITNYKLRLVMNGPGTIATFASTPNLYSVQASANISVSSSVTLNGAVAGWGLTVDNGKTVTLGAGVVFTHTMYGIAADLSNAGYINGPGTLRFLMGESHALTLKNISCTVAIVGSGGAASSSATLTVDASVGALSVTHGNAASIETLNLNGHRLTAGALLGSTRSVISSSVPGARLVCAGITVAAAGSFDRTNFSQIRVTPGGNVDMSAGTSANGTELWVFEGSGSVKLAAGQSLYDVIDKGVRARLSDVPIANLYAHVNPMTESFSTVLTAPGNEYTGLRRPVVMPLTPLDIGAVGPADEWMEWLGACV